MPTWWPRRRGRRWPPRLERADITGGEKSLRRSKEKVMSDRTDNFHASYRASETGASPFPPRSSKPQLRRGGADDAQSHLAPNLRYGEEAHLYGTARKEWTSSCLMMFAVIVLIGAAIFCCGKFATSSA
jgi:hypothetical protein